MYGAIVFWFVLRAAIKRKATSAAMATMALGFPAFTLVRMNVLGPVAVATIEWLSLLVGLFVLWSVVKAEHLFAQSAVPSRTNGRPNPDVQNPEAGARV